MEEKEIKYGEAMKQLEAILKKIEKEEVDIDELSSCVKEAASLIKICKKKIQATSVEVKKVVESLEQEE